MSIPSPWLACLLLVPGLVLAEPSARPASGTWVMNAGGCEMRFEITADDRVVRHTGTLQYDAWASFRPEGRGWVLSEELHTHNEGKSCRGEAAAVVTQHLETEAYIEVLEDRLIYYPSRLEGRRLEFQRRADAEQAPAS